jgi:hypothetical protein
MRLRAAGLEKPAHARTRDIDAQTLPGRLTGHARPLLTLSYVGEGALALAR